MAIDKSDLEKLSPQERIKKLKELEKQIELERKNQLSEIGLLIKKSMQEMKNVKLADEIAPRQREIEISSLFEKNDDNSNNLESAARYPQREFEGNMNYHPAIQMYKDYSQLKQMYGMVSTGGALTSEQINAINSINERIGVAERYIGEGEKLSSVLDSTRSLMYGLRKRTGL